MRVMREHEFWQLPNASLYVAKWSEREQLYNSITTWDFKQSNNFLYTARFGLSGNVRREFVFKRGDAVYVSEIDFDLFDNDAHKQLHAFMKAGMSPEDAISLVEL